MQAKDVGNQGADLPHAAGHCRKTEPTQDAGVLAAGKHELGLLPGCRPAEYCMLARALFRLFLEKAFSNTLKYLI